MSFDATQYEAVIFDMDGVITDTAKVHQAAWKELFDHFLEDRFGPDFEPFSPEDYREYVDGKPRYDGAAAFLESRGIELPYGSPDDPPEKETVCGLANRKNGLFHEQLEKHGAERYDGTVRFIEQLREQGLGVAAISSSRNAHEVLARAGVDDLFDVAVTGIESDELGLAGKPAPDIFLEAARRLGVDPDRAVVVEDAVAGVEAGERGGFGLVIGVDRGGAGGLDKRGADLVVDDLEVLCDE